MINRYINKLNKIKVTMIKKISMNYSSLFLLKIKLKVKYKKNFKNIFKFSVDKICERC